MKIYNLDGLKLSNRKDDNNFVFFKDFIVEQSDLAIILF